MRNTDIVGQLSPSLYDRSVFFILFRAKKEKSLRPAAADIEWFNL